MFLLFGSWVPVIARSFLFGLHFGLFGSVGLFFFFLRFESSKKKKKKKSEEEERRKHQGKTSKTRSIEEGQTIIFGTTFNFVDTIENTKLHLLGSNRCMGK